MYTKHLFKKTKLTFLCGFCFFVSPVFADDYSFNLPLDLGTLATDNNGNSYANAVSADGIVVVGYAATDSGTSHAFRYNLSDAKMTDLGTLAADNSGNSYANAVSANGYVVVGYAATDAGTSHAFRHNEGDVKMTDLGTLKADNSGDSNAEAVSSDGRVVVGSAATDAGINHAFRHNIGDTKMTDLGTLLTDNSGASNALAVSADGRVVVGWSATDSGNNHAFRHNEGDAKMTDLGTLIEGNSGSSTALAVSDDGRVVVGQSQVSTGNYHAFRHNEGDVKMTDLGTLATDNSGGSKANAISSDGRVVVGQASTGTLSYVHAFRHNEGDTKMTDLGTLATDNNGWSYAYGVSSDGRVVVGEADTNVGTSHAFWHHEGDAKMTDLGTLKADGSGNSYALSVSADGMIVAGSSDTDANTTHAVVWKVKYLETPVVPGNPVTPGNPVVPGDPVSPEKPIVIIVDKDNSHIAMAKTANNAQKVLSLYQASLDALSTSRCQIGQSNYCVGVFSQLNAAQGNSAMASGLFGALRLPNEHFIVGASFNLPYNTSLVNGYDTRGSLKPGVGLFAGYQSNSDKSGLNIDLSGSYLEQGVTIQREILSHTEAGKGDATIKGYQAKLIATYGFNVSDKTQLSPLVGLKYENVYRTAYTEDRNAEFLASYGKMGTETTDLQLGLELSHQLTSTVRLNGGAGADINLNRKRNAFTGRIDYIGAYAYDKGETQDVKPYVYAGVNVDVTPNSTVRVSGGWQQTDYSKNAGSAAMSYSYHW